MSALGDLLAQTGGKTAKFDTIGASVTGTVISAEARQRTDLDTGKPATWDNGDPQMQVVIVLATDERDPADPDDDGHRAVYVKTWGPQWRALKDAVRQAGMKDITPGATFTATYSGDGEKPKPHMSAPKLFTYQLTPGSSTAGLFAGEAQQDTAPATAPAASGPTPADVATAKNLIAAGLDDATVRASAPTVTPEVLQALRNAAA